MYLENPVDRRKQPYYNSARTAPAALLGLQFVFTSLTYKVTWKNYPQLPRSAGVW
jgi:hypothetical protein